MSNIKKQIAKCKHPNSRKTLALAKQINKSSNRNKQKLGQYIKQNITAEKIAWFRDRLNPDITTCTPDLVQDLIQQYLSRFDEELDQISIKHSIGGRKNRQHANREDVIKLTRKQELEEYNTCGIEMPDLLNNHNLSVVLKWNGELRFLQNIKLKRIGKKHLQQLKEDLLKKENKTVNNERGEENMKDVHEFKMNNNMDVDSL